MAICHISVSIISRGKGKTAVAAAAYRAGEKITCEYDGRINDYSRKKGIIHKEIMLPKNAPQEYYDRSILWNAVEKAERYKTAQLAREIIIALPVELTKEQNIKLGREYVQRNFVAAGMCADLCVHDDGGGNPHLHLLLSMRPIEKDGKWGQKSQLVNGKKVPSVDWNEHTKVEEWRKAWADIQNEYLKKYNIKTRVDHRSFERQGREQVPTKHLGHAAHQMEKRGVCTVRGDWNRYAAITNNELRQLNGRIRKVKNELYDLPLIDAPSAMDCAKSIISWRDTTSNYVKARKLQDFINVTEYLHRHKITDISDVAKKSEELHDIIREYSQLVRSENRRIDTLSEHLAQYEIYNKYRSLAKKNNELPEKKREEFYIKHRNELENYKSAHDYLSKVMNGKGKPPVDDWKKELKERQKLRWDLCDLYYDIRSELKAIETIRRSVDHLMDDIVPKEQRQRVHDIEL